MGTLPHSLEVVNPVFCYCDNLFRVEWYYRTGSLEMFTVVVTLHCRKGSLLSLLTPTRLVTSLTESECRMVAPP